MSKKKKIGFGILGAFITILIIAMAATCPLDAPAPTPRPAPEAITPQPEAPPPQPEIPPSQPEAPLPESSTFELKKWEVIDDNRVAALQISFSATKDLKFVLTDPTGVEVDSEYTELGVTGARLRMAGYGETPPAGEYTLLVKKMFGEFVDSISFDFEGADLEVSDVGTSWEFYAYEFWEAYYDLEGLEISVINHGDLPAYIDEAELKLNGETEELYFFNGAVLPGEEETFTESAFIYDIEPGKYDLELKLKDSTGQTLATYSTTVSPPTVRPRE